MPDPPAPRLLRVAGGLCLLEAVAVAAMGVVEIVNLDSARLAVGVTTSVFFVVYATGLACAGYAVAGAHSWARAPLVLSQLIQLGVAWSFFGSGTTWVTVLLAVPAVAVTVILVLPASTAALYGESTPEDVRAG